MSPKIIAIHISQSCTSQKILGFSFAFVEIVERVDRDKHSSSDHGNAREQLAAQPKKAEEGGSIEANNVDHLVLVGMDKGGYPTEDARACLWRALFASMVLLLWRINNFICGTENGESKKGQNLRERKLLVSFIRWAS
jgi:hypothetical protein